MVEVLPPAIAPTWRGRALDWQRGCQEKRHRLHHRDDWRERVRNAPARAKQVTSSTPRVRRNPPLRSGRVSDHWCSTRPLQTTNLFPRRAGKRRAGIGFAVEKRGSVKQGPSSLPTRRDRLSLVGRLIALLAVVAASGLFGYYRRWLEAQRRRASEASVTLTTAMGPVEYDQRGEGPTVVHFHGGNVGHNGWFFLNHLVTAPRREANYQDSSLLRRCSRMGPGRHGDEGGGPKGRGVVGQVVRVDYPRTFLRGKDDSFNSQGLHQF